MLDALRDTDLTVQPSAASTDLEQAYAQKKSGYFSGARSDFVALLPRNPSASILEVGCAEGATGDLALREGKCGRYVGVELMGDAAARARRVLSDVIVGNVESLDLDLRPATFDALIMSEVLEHLIDPWATLGKLGAYLKPGALALASSPNVSYWKVLRALVRGRFDYAERGTMDRTHLRWFTPATYAELFEAAGYRVERVWPISPAKPHQRLIAALLGGREHLFCAQVCLAARWRGSADNGPHRIPT